jgi:hypothetical protein
MQMQRVFHYITLEPVRGFMMGGGLAFAWSNGYWHHTPLVLLNPYAYTAYQLYTSKEQVVHWTKSEFVASTSTHSPPV